MADLSNGYFKHVTTEGERWDLIAHRYYGDASRQSAIVKANRGIFVDAETGAIGPVPSILKGGLTLNIPVLEERLDETLLPPWKRGQPRPGV